MNLRMDDLPLADAARIRYLMQACIELEREQYPTQHFATAATVVSAKLAGLEGAASRPLSMQTMRRLYYDWKNGKNDKQTGRQLAAPRTWQCLIDRRTVAANRRRTRTASPAFISHLELLAGRHPLSLATAIKELYDDWASCKTIPGYEGMNPEPNMPLPEGWSYDNLMRRMPDRAALTILHKGTRAGYNYLAQGFSTREGLWPGAIFSFDDVWLDCKVQGYDGSGRMHIDRPLQLGCLDRYTGKRMSWFTKLRTKGEDGKSLQLTEDEMLYLICDLLLNVGYSQRGTVFVCEHGTAAISREVEEQLAIISGGKISVKRSGMTGIRQVGAFEGRGVGNPRFKAELESWHNLLHNRMDGVLTQTGKNRTEPERLYGITEKHDAAIVKAVNTGKGLHNKQLSDAQVAGLATFSLSLGELADMLVQVVGGINKRTNHKLQGWKECGFIQPEFSFNGRDGWELLSSMPPEKAEESLRLEKRGFGSLRARSLSPDEAWLHSLHAPGNELVRFTPAECVALMGAHRKFKLQQKGGALFVTGTSRHHRELMFSNVILDANGYEQTLPLVSDWYGVLNPLSEDLFILDEKNVVRGIAQRRHRIRHNDEAARLRMFGDMVQRRAEELARIENMVAPDTAKHRIQMDYNHRILAGEQVDPLAVADERTTRRLANRAKRTPEPEPAYLPTPAPAGLDLPDSYESSSFNY